MAIFGPSWASGDQITRTKQANMVADGINTTDDIHPQYLPSFYSDDAVHTLLVSNAGPVSTYTILHAGGGVRLQYLHPGTSQLILVKEIGIKLLPSFSMSNLHIGFDAAKAGAGAKNIVYSIMKNGVSVVYAAPAIVSVFPAYANYSIDTALAGLNANDIIEVALAMSITFGAVETLYLKNIEIYFS